MLVIRETGKSDRSLRACARRRHDGYPFARTENSAHPVSRAALYNLTHPMAMRTGVASENSDSCISMVQSAKDRLRNNVSEPLNRACAGCVLAKRKVRPHLIIVARVFRKNAPKMFFVEHDHVV